MLNTNKGGFYDATECCHTYCLAWIARQRDACDETVSSTLCTINLHVKGLFAWERFLQIYFLSRLWCSLISEVAIFQRNRRWESLLEKVWRKIEIWSRRNTTTLNIRFLSQILPSDFVQVKEIPNTRRNGNVLCSSPFDKNPSLLKYRSCITPYIRISSLLTRDFQ